MERFLESIAKAYCTLYKGNLEEVLFVFPNKRAGSFFLRELYRQKDLEHEKVCEDDRLTMLMPAVTSFADFVETLSGRIIDSRIDSICRLYHLYCLLWDEEHNDDKADKEAKKGKASFDKFRSWAETMLSDFNDVEMYQVNAEALFENVDRFKKIKSTYLTPEQLRVMSAYFGYTEFYEDSDRMWQHYHGSLKDGIKDKRRRFMTLFELMGKLYTRFCDSLERDGLTFRGRAYSQALKALSDGDPAMLLPYKRVVMVGFNALSTVEYLIFEKLERTKVTLADGTLQPLGDFYWDLTGTALAHPGNIGRHFVEKNQKAFPPQFDISASNRPGLPATLEVISSPSGVAQAKIAGKIVRDIVSDEGRQLVRDADIAVVLPDENLLLPMIYSMPDIGTAEDDASFNITMGYPFKVTSVASFMALLENLQRGYAYENGVSIARTADVDALLSTPLATVLLSWEHSSSLFRSLEDRRRETVPYTFFADYCNQAEEIAPEERQAILDLFRPLPRNADSQQTIDYLRTQLESLDNLIKEKDGEGRRLRHDRRLKEMDSAHVLLHLAALNQLEEAFHTYRIKANARTTFRLYNNLMAGEQVRFQGEPLTGVQIMGPLETRCLDIPYLVIPSMNERIYPRRMDRKSFIPAVIRRGFGMATTQFQEAIFTYYFYRMISRARGVYLIYDSRTEGLHSGSPSRFILQLRHLYARNRVRFTRYNFQTTPARPELVTVAKTGDIPQEIDRYFRQDLDKNEIRHLSASSLNRLISCPLYFYISSLRRIDQDTKPSDGMTSADIGSVVHNALQHIYLSMAENGSYPIEVTTEKLAAACTDTAIRPFVIAAVNIEVYKADRDANGNKITPAPEALTKEPEPTVLSLVPHMVAMVKNVLAHDMNRYAPFSILSMEDKKNVTYQLTDGSLANLTYIIDRVDEKDGQVRIVDYKTGAYHERAADMDEIFACGEKQHPDSLFQLMLYSYLWMRDNPDKFTGTVRPLIYDLAEMSDPAKGEKPAKLGKNGKNFTDADLVGAHDDFMQKFEALLTDLRDPEHPFAQAPSNSSACTYCPFAKPICNRVTDK